MNVAQLTQILKFKKAHPDAVKIGSGLPQADEQYCIVNEGNSWEVYYAERGQKGSLKQFDNEDEACTYLLSILDSDESVWLKIK